MLQRHRLTRRWGRDARFSFRAGCLMRIVQKVDFLLSLMGRN